MYMYFLYIYIFIVCVCDDADDEGSVRLLCVFDRMRSRPQFGKKTCYLNNILDSIQYLNTILGSIA